MLVFGVENQGGFGWSLLWTLDAGETDPTVWFCDDSEKPIAVAAGLVMHVCEAGDNKFEAWVGATHRSTLDLLADAPVE
ncbi:hypothetical protein [Streptomyces phaeofaciens]|uniref:hypothetical protein n=1 Tax=Streptomyces phaeofaciens TaxID=68254 RepID=UPI0036AED03D